MSNSLHKKVFYMWPEGPDSDYGPIRHETVVVTIEQSWPFDDEQISDMRDALKEHFDCTPRTSEELAEEEAYWENEAKKLSSPTP